MARLDRNARPSRARIAIAIAVVVAGLAAASARGAFASQDPSLREARTPDAAFADLVASRAVGDVAASASALATLAAFPHPLVRALLERAVDPARDDDAVRAALEVLGALGVPADLALAPPLARAGLETELADAIAAIARRDVRALPVLEGLERAATTEVRAAFVRAVERVGTPVAAAWLGRCASRSPDVRGEAIARLGRLAESLPQPAPDDASRSVREVLGGIPSDALRDAVIAAGRIEDGESIPYLIPLLREEDHGLRTDAVWALERISGLCLRERPEAWESWYAVELAWSRDEAESVFAGLDSAESRTRLRALFTIGGHRASRDRLSLRALPLLEDPDAEVARTAARTLRQLASKVAVAALVRAMERSDPELVRESWTALRAITRKDLPCDAAAWRSACGIESS